MAPPTLEDVMGIVLFLLGFAMLMVAFLNALGAIALISGNMIIIFFVFGFILCVVGYLIARSSTGYY